MRRLRAAVALAAAALVMLAVVVWLLLWISLPPDEGRFAMPGLGAPATVHYDAWQRPFVEAASLGDALQVQGWLHGSHRLWQMEMFRRAGSGRLAEILGPDALTADRELWRVGVPQLARKLERNASARTLRLIDRYLQGVNAAVARYPVLPPEFLLLRAPRRDWTRADVFAVGALTAFQSANNMENELLRLALAARLDPARYAAFTTEGSDRPDYPFVLSGLEQQGALRRAMDRLASLDPAANPLMPRLGFGSNGWVVSGRRSVSSAPLYAFDSHDELGLPNLFYEVHLFFEGNRQLRGWSVAGLPGVINGFNEHIAWGFTNIGDTQDLFLERRSAEDPLLFRDGDTWYRARVETVRIPVAGAAPEELRIVHTVNGPLISEEPPVSLAWTMHRLEQARLDSLLDLNLAGDWHAFTRALDALPAPTLNATYADVHGRIGLRTGGVIPQRRRGAGLAPLDGSDPANRWQGMVPVSAMPEIADPAAGYLAAANARVNPPGSGPLVSADNAAPYRIRRLHQVLGGNARFTTATMAELQMDWTDGQAQYLLPVLLTLAGDAEAGTPAARALALLQAWRANPVAKPDSAAALLFQQWYVALGARLFEEALGDQWPPLLRRAYVFNHALDHLLLRDADSPWWDGRRRAMVRAALDDAIATLAARLGHDLSRWRLDALQSVSLRHPLGSAVPLLGLLLDRPDARWGGSPASVGRARYSYTRPFAVNVAATVRAVAEMRPAPMVQSVMPGGQSGHPLSAHYADQYPAWLGGELLPIAQRPADVGGSRLEFTPIKKEGTGP